MIRKSIFIFLIILINGITNTSPVNLLLTIPQLFIVLYYLITGKLEKAAFWHILFFITSYSYFGDFQGYAEGLTSYNYAKLKFIGPISYSHISSILLFIIVNIKYNNKLSCRSVIFYQFYKLIIFFMVTGFGIGIIGLAFSNYYIEGFIQYGSYIFLIFMHTNILLKLHNTSLKNNFQEIIIQLLTFPQIINFILHLFYPEIIDSTGISLFSILLLPAILVNKTILLNIIGLSFLTLNMIMFGSSGKELIFIVIIAIITFTLSFSKSIKNNYPIRARFIRLTMAMFLLAIPTLTVLFYDNYIISSSNIVYKIYQVETLFNFIFTGTGVEKIAPSPYVRVTSLINILYEGIQNPFKLFFGKGYGGYFQDHFYFFTHLNLSGGGFTDKEILSDHYYTGHDTMVTVPMFNGLVGLFLLLKLVWKCIKFSKYNFLILSAVPFLLLVFYFNTLIGITGVLFLFLGSVALNNYK